MGIFILSYIASKIHKEKLMCVVKIDEGNVIVLTSVNSDRGSHLILPNSKLHHVQLYVYVYIRPHLAYMFMHTYAYTQNTHTCD